MNYLKVHSANGFVQATYQHVHTTFLKVHATNGKIQSTSLLCFLNMEKYG